MKQRDRSVAQRARRGFALVALALCAGSTLGAQASSASATRIVTLGGAITETVFALGAGAQVVGVDASSTYPAGVRALPNVGIYRQAGAEGIMALRPTLVIADAESSAATLAQLRGARVRVVVVPAGESEAVALARIAEIGVAIGRTAAADSLGRHVRTGVARATAMARQQAAAQPNGRLPRALFIYARGMGTLFVAGAGTGANEMLRLAGAQNVVTDFSGYKPFTAESVAMSGADVIVLPTHGLESLGGIDALLRLPGLAQTPAGRARRVVTVADDLLLGFGPRLPEAIDALARVLHGTAAANATMPLDDLRR